MYSKHSAPESRILGIIRNNDIMLRGFFQINKQNGFRCVRAKRNFTQKRILLESGRDPSPHFLVRRKEMFQNVNYEKKQVWEVIAAIMQAESVESGRNISPQADQCEGKWKALTLGFRKCEDHNSQTGNERRECPFYKELSEVYGYWPNVRPYAKASSSGQGNSLRCPENDSAKSEKSSDDDVKERTPETSTATKKRKTMASSSTTPKKPRLGSGGRNECLAWFKDYAEQKRVEQEAQR